MWRGLVLVAVVVALGCVALALAPSAPAAPTPPTQSASDVGIGAQDYLATVWFVEYRGNAKMKWRIHSGPYSVKKEAEKVAATLRKEGYLSRVVK